MIRLLESHFGERYFSVERKLAPTLDLSVEFEWHINVDGHYVILSDAELEHLIGLFSQVAKSAEDKIKGEA